MNWRIGWVPFSALLVAQAAQAQSVGYEETLAAARAEQPMLEAGALRVQARRDAADAADELPDPRVRAGVMNLPVTGPAAFNPYAQLPTQLAVGIEQEIPNLARRRARWPCRSEIGIAEARLGLSERSILAEAGTAWIGLYYAQQRLALARDSLDSLRDFVPVAVSAVASGSARPAESLAIRRELLEIEDAITRIEAARAAARARLQRYIAGSEPVAAGGAPQVTVDPEELPVRVGADPELRLADAEQRRAEAAADLARAEKRPDFGVSVTYGHRNPDFGSAVSVMGSVTAIFTDRRQNPRIAAAEADAAAASAERVDRLRVIRARFEADLAAWRSAAAVGTCA